MQQFVPTISFGKIIFQEYRVLAGLYFELPFFRLFEFGADPSHCLLFYYTLLGMRKAETLNLGRGRQEGNKQC